MIEPNSGRAQAGNATSAWASSLSLERDRKVPDEVFWGKKPDISHLEEFGKTCWVLQQDGNNSKLDPKSRKFIFVGVADGTKGYRYYNSKTHQILTSRNVVFMADGDGSDVVEVTHPAPLEGESGISGKQTSGGNEDSITSKWITYQKWKPITHHHHAYQFLGNDQTAFSRNRLLITGC